MKLFLLTFTTWLSCLAVLCAQEIVVIGGIENIQSTRTDSIIVLSILGNPFSQNELQNNILVSDTYNPFLSSTDSITPVRTLSPIKGLKIYPNPTPDILVLHRQDIGEQLTIDVYDMNGILIRSWNWPPGVGNFQPSLQSFTPGVYVLAVCTEDKSKMSHYKIVKQ